MLFLKNSVSRKHRLLRVAVLALMLVVLLGLAGITMAGLRVLPPAPEGCRYVIVEVNQRFLGQVLVCSPEDSACDYGRNPETLWPDNPDGHPFERAFCDGLTEVQYKHPLDSLENEGLYCDEVPGCWAYGMTQEGHH